MQKIKLYDENRNHIDIAAAYMEYTQEIQEEIEKAVMKRGEQMYEEILKDCPVDTKTLLNSLTIKKVHTKDYCRFRVYSNDNLRRSVVHLVDRGHNMYRGRRYAGTMFISNAQRKYRNLLREDVLEILKK